MTDVSQSERRARPLKRVVWWISFVATTIVIGVPGFMLLDAMKDHFGPIWTDVFVVAVIVLCLENLLQRSEPRP